jgi:glycine betaine/proline transport system ATP-binding protein
LILNSENTTIFLHTKGETFKMNEKNIKIKVKNVYKVFGEHPKKALKMYNDGVSKNDIMEKTGHAIGVVDASFDVYEGEILVVMGLSGSGKSTLLRCINRLYEPTDGKIEIDGIDVTKLDEEGLRRFRQKKFGMVFQKFALFPHKNILQNTAYGLELQRLDKVEREKAANKALEQVGLKGWENSYPEQLSGGMQQRVGLARALAVDPDILLMDEAFSALDPLIRTGMQDELIALQEKVKKTILFITHDLDEALKMGDRIVLMKDGVIVQIGTPEDILINPANDYVAKFLENVDYTKVLTASDVMVKPRAVVYEKDGPRTSLRRMKQNGVSGLFVVDREYHLKGYVTAKNAGKLADKKEKYITSIIENYDKQKVLPDMPVRDLFQVMVDNRYPIAVVDKKNILKGLIVNGSIIAGLAERSEINV